MTPHEEVTKCVLPVLRELFQDVTTQMGYAPRMGICTTAYDYAKARGQGHVLTDRYLKPTFTALGLDDSYPLGLDYSNHLFAKTLWFGQQRHLRVALLYKLIAYFEANYE